MTRACHTSTGTNNNPPGAINAKSHNAHRMKAAMADVQGRFRAGPLTH